MEEREEISQPLVGEIIQARRLNQHQRGVIDFSDSRGLGIAIELPQKQAECIVGYLTEGPSKKWYFWIQKEQGFRGWRGLVIAGPFDEKDEKSLIFLSDEQIRRWYNRLLSPLSNIPRVEEINPVGKLSFKVGEEREVGFQEIWQTFKEEEEREKKGLMKEAKFDKQIRGLLRRKGISGEAARRYLKK